MKYFRSISLCLCTLLVFSVPSLAKKNDEQASVSPWLYKKLNNTEKLLANKKYGKALEKLQTILHKVDQGSYGEAIVLRSMSSVYARQEKYQKAAEFLASVVKLNVLPENQQQQALFNLGQLYMATEQFSKAVGLLRPWLTESSNQDAQIYLLLAKAYTQLNQYREAIFYIKKAIQLTKKTNESWYQLNLALYYELKEYRSCTKLLRYLIEIYPDKKQYWFQLAAIYQQIKQYDKAVTIKKLTYKNGFLVTEQELLELVNLMLYIDLPYQAAHILAKEINHKHIKNNSENWALLANAWTQAKEFERAIKALENASKLNENGLLYFQLGQIYVEREQWPLAINSFNKALAKGGLTEPGNTYVLLGLSYHGLKQMKQAKQAFLKARNYSASQKTANQWLAFISG